MDRVLANQEDLSEIQRSIRVSVELNKSTRLFIVGHHDCRGNPVKEEVHRQNIASSVERLKGLWPTHEIIGLWVNGKWKVEAIASPR